MPRRQNGGCPQVMGMGVGGALAGYQALCWALYLLGTSSGCAVISEGQTLRRGSWARPHSWADTHHPESSRVHQGPPERQGEPRERMGSGSAPGQDGGDWQARRRLGE